MGNEIPHELSEPESSGLGFLPTMGAVVPLEEKVAIEASGHGIKMQGPGSIFKESGTQATTDSIRVATGEHPWAMGDSSG